MAREVAKGGATSTLGQPRVSSPSAPLLAGLAAAWAVALSAAALQPARIAVLLLLGLGALAVLGAVWAFARQRLVDVLFIAFLALVTIPIVKHFAYRAHVGGWPGIRVSAADLCLLLLLPLGALGWLMGRTRNAVPRVVLACYGLWILQYVISLLGATDRVLALFEVASAIHALIVAVAVAALFRRDYLGLILFAVALQVVVHTGFATAQGITGQPIGAQWLRSREEVLEEKLVSGKVRLRPSGLFDHPIVYADFLLVSLPVLAAGAFAVRSRRQKVGLVAVFALGFASFLATLSRGAWLSFAFAFALLLGLGLYFRLLDRRDLTRVLAVATALGLLLGVIFAPRIYERFTQADVGNVEVRFELNWIALSMIEAHPFLGVGPNNFLGVMEQFDPRNVGKYFPATVHNLYLLEGAEAGVPGLLLFVGVFTMVFVTTLRRVRLLVDRRLQWFALALIAGLAGFSVSQVGDFSHRLEPLRSMLWTNVGLLFGTLNAESRDGERPM